METKNPSRMETIKIISVCVFVAALVAVQFMAQINRKKRKNEENEDPGENSNT